MKTLTCPICGHHFNPAGLTACQSCPFHEGCSVVCCPACGHSMIDPDRSKLAQWLTKLFNLDRTDEPISKRE